MGFTEMAVAIEPVSGTRGALKCRRKFLRFFRRGFYDEKYIDWERGYKWQAHERWQKLLGREEHGSFVRAGDYAEVARIAVSIESRTNLLFSFEKMALRDAVKSPAGAKVFAEGLYDSLRPGQRPEQIRTLVRVRCRTSETSDPGADVATGDHFRFSRAS